MNRAEAARLKLLAVFPRGTWDGLLDSAGGLDAEMSSIRARMEAALAEHEARMAPMRAYIAQLQEYEQLAGPVAAAGWLPHETTPFNLVRAHNDADTLNRAMEAYYSANWADVAAHFLRRLDTQCVDDEAKDLFRECLTAHGAKLYRMAALALFPEIERVVRIEIGWGAEQTSTSQIELRDVIGGLTPIEMQTPGWYGLHLAGKLDEHLYAKVRTPAQRRAAEQDPVPNRHAALHGYVTYASARSSFNMLVMADFVFAAVTAIKRFAPRMISKPIMQPSSGDADHNQA
ncbi:hypothetical protein [Sphingomonas bacterium]|uniref:hypothetical protein n=1 Tax=Sphingomonas bacterium TaxID=1895847 RepID=UPI0015751BC9|nr:hypothetical protein [Sphingomonas bacterium]